jgi:hypothetical protein
VAAKRFTDKLFAADPWRGRRTEEPPADEGRTTPSETTWRPRR